MGLLLPRHQYNNRSLFFFVVVITLFKIGLRIIEVRGKKEEINTMLMVDSKELVTLNGFMLTVLSLYQIPTSTKFEVTKGNN